MRFLPVTFLVLHALSLCALAQERPQRQAFTFCCAPANDLFAALSTSGAAPKRTDTPTEAIEIAAPNSAVLILADSFPSERVVIHAPDFAKAAEKRLRIYCEFPEFVPGIEFGSPRKTSWERIVVSSEHFSSRLPKNQILMAHDSTVLPCTAPDPILVTARVAGYNTAVYGIPKSAEPILFTLEDGRLIVATTKLSGFRTARFAPAREWAVLWNEILTHLSGESGKALKWESVISPACHPNEVLPEGFERRALEATARWIGDSNLLLTEERWSEVRSLLQRNIELLEPAPPNSPSGDGRFGILEGYASNIRHDGSQPQRTPVRADCQAESAMVLAAAAALSKNDRYRAVASNLLDFLYFNSDLCTGPRGNPKHPAFGLIAWGSTSPLWTTATYGDDNARTILASLLTAAALQTDRWDESLLRALHANLRTTGAYGFRGDRIDLPALEQHGWQHFHDAKTISYSPHFEAFSWACFLWAYQYTGEREFLVKAETAIRKTMEGFPDKWRWNDNMERAHMLLPLAWLIRINDTPEHRDWLQRLANDFIGIQHSSGAFPERFRGGPGSHFQIPASNEAYGTGETPLIQENGDPVSDQLYVGGFALLGLHEAAAVSGDARIKAAEDKLAEYLCRIQTRSSRFPYLNGTWFRAFDFDKWEPWASSGDAGWGAWSVEAGWAQSWTAAALSLRTMKTTLWELTSQTRIKEKIPQVLDEMAQNTGGPYHKDQNSAP